MNIYIADSTVLYVSLMAKGGAAQALRSLNDVEPYKPIARGKSSKDFMGFFVSKPYFDASSLDVSEYVLETIPVVSLGVRLFQLLTKLSKPENRKVIYQIVDSAKFEIQNYDQVLGSHKQMGGHILGYLAHQDLVETMAEAQA